MKYETIVKVYQSPTSTITYESTIDALTMEEATIQALVQARVGSQGQLISVHVYTTERLAPFVQDADAGEPLPAGEPDARD